MSDWCVFCGAETSDGSIVCPKCQPYRDSLTEDKRRLLEQMEADNKARETVQVASVNFRVAMEELFDTGVALFHLFWRGGKP